MSVADDGIFTFVKDGFTIKYRDPTARDILRVRYAHALLNQERLQKMAKHADAAEKSGDSKASSLLVDLQVRLASDTELEYYAAAIVEPTMSVDDVGNLPGEVFEALQTAFRRTVRKALISFRLTGPGIPDDATSRVGGGPDGENVVDGNAQYAVERASSTVDAAKSR